MSIHEWNQYKTDWLSGPFNEIDAIECEKWVNQRIRQLNQAVRFFKKRKLNDVADLTDKLKG
jgi:hypothetical protein